MRTWETTNCGFDWLSFWLRDVVSCAMQVVLYVTQGIKGIAGIMALTGATIIVNVLGSQCPGQLGSVVGASQTLLNLVRAVGPALGGLAWALSVSSGAPGHQFRPFVAIAAAALCTTVLYSRRLPLRAVER